MNPRLFLFLLCLMAPLSAAQTTRSIVVTAAQVNGTWRNKSSEFKVLALGRQKLKVEFTGTHEIKTSAGVMANVGGAHGIALIEGDTAVFNPEGGGADCQITLKFAEDKLAVEQKGSCDFGRGVSATGTYRKASNRKPKFEEE